MSRKGARRAARIVEAGAEILLEEGFNAVNKRRIAARLGISDGNVSYYFPSREALWMAVIDHELAAYHRRHQGRLDDFRGDPQALFDSYVASWIDEYQDRLVRVFFSQILTAAEVHEGIARRRDEIYEAFLAQTMALARPLVAGLAEDEIERRALIVMALLEGLHAVTAFRPDTLSAGGALKAGVLEQVEAVMLAQAAAL